MVSKKVIFETSLQFDLRSANVVTQEDNTGAFLKRERGDELNNLFPSRKEFLKVEGKEYSLLESKAYSSLTSFGSIPK